MIFETHAHYEDARFDEDREELLSSLSSHGIERVINVGSTMETSRKTLALTKAYDEIYGAVGIHPSEVKDCTSEDLEELRELAKDSKVIALGEIGLDYYWDKEAEIQNRQRDWFRMQLSLAEERQLPVIIHSRDAAKDTMDLLKEEEAKNLTGVIHCYSGSVEMAREYVKMGYYLGIGGVVTFKNAKVLKDVVREIDLSHLLLETDCPYMAPEPHRGKRNSSLYLPLIAEEIGRLKGIEPEEVAVTTRANAYRLFFKE